jgi:signal peptidase II
MTPLRRLALALVLVLFLADQLFKYWILEGLNLPEVGSIPLLPFFSLTMVWNPGISMGMFRADTDLGRWMLVGFTALVALLVAVWLWREKSRINAIPLAMILGGALGNIVDRIRFGAVADFFHIHVGSWSFYVFNVADAAITLGVIALLIAPFIEKKIDSSAAPSKTAGP